MRQRNQAVWTLLILRVGGFGGCRCRGLSVLQGYQALRSA